MPLLHAQARRLYESIAKRAGEDAAREILEALPLSKAPSDAKKAEWARGAQQALESRLGEDAARAVRMGCHCKPGEARVKPLRALYEACDTLQAFAARASEGETAFTIEAEGDALVLCYPRCYCSFARHSIDMPEGWCDCSLGYAEEMFARVTGKPVRAELAESVLAGAPGCRIRVYIEK